jgi:hypothetical protein
MIASCRRADSQEKPPEVQAPPVASGPMKTGAIGESLWAGSTSTPVFDLVDSAQPKWLEF